MNNTQIVSEDILCHSGPFHADDVVAVAMAKWKAVGGVARDWGKIIRTRDSGLIAQAEKAGGLVIDVGGEYAPGRGRFDHHFKDSPKREDDGTLYASAGLVAAEIELPAHLEQVIRSIDAADTGTKVPGWSFSMTIHKCNPLGSSLEEFDKRFETLVELVREAFPHEDFVERVERDPQVVQWVAEHDAEMAASEARIRKAFIESEEPVLVLQGYEPALFEVASEAPSHILFSVYPSPGGEWMVQQIPLEKGGFAGRKQLPDSWAGKRGEELDTCTGITGCVFVHPGRFIGGNRTLEGAIRMACLAAAL